MDIKALAHHHFGVSALQFSMGPASKMRTLCKNGISIVFSLGCVDAPLATTRRLRPGEVTRVHVTVLLHSVRNDTFEARER